jgi:hypothetical protein
MKKIFALLALTIGAVFKAHAGNDLYGNDNILFSCDVNDEKRYGTHIDDVPGKCTILPPLSDNWILVSISTDGKRAFYFDTQSIKWRGDIAELSMLLLKPEVNQIASPAGANLNDELAPALIALFDLKQHKFFDCTNSTQRTDKIELFRNFRTNPQLVKSFIDNNRAPQVISHMESPDGRILQFVCSKRSEEATKSKVR